MHPVTQPTILFSELGLLPPALLHERCHARRQSHPAEEWYCWELFRRAITERNEACWAAILDEFRGLVRSWLSRSPHAAHFTADLLDDLVVRAFTKLWQYYTAQKLSEARSLAPILKYLQLCTTTCLQEIGRANQNRPSEVALQEHLPQTILPGVAEATLEAMQNAKLWAIVEAVCLDEAERAIARLALVDGLKPAEIVAEAPTLFADVQEVYRVKRNLLTRLANNNELRAMNSGQ